MVKQNITERRNPLRVALERSRGSDDHSSRMMGCPKIRDIASFNCSHVFESPWLFIARDLAISDLRLHKRTRWGFLAGRDGSPGHQFAASLAPETDGAQVCGTQQ